MEEMTIQRRTITIPKEKVRCKIKWTDRQRIPRKLKKKYKKRGLLNLRLAISPAIRQILEFKDMRFLTDFLTGTPQENTLKPLTTKDHEKYWSQHATGVLPINNSGLYVGGIDEYDEDLKNLNNGK